GRCTASSLKGKSTKPVVAKIQQLHSDPISRLSFRDNGRLIRYALLAPHISEKATRQNTSERLMSGESGTSLGGVSTSSRFVSSAGARRGSSLMLTIPTSPKSPAARP